MKKIIFPVIFVGFLILVGCPNNPVSPQPTPIVTDTVLCPSAEEHLQNLCKEDPSGNAYCCKIVAPTKKGKSFTQVCIELQNNGVFFNPKCIASVTSCDQIDQCTRSSN